MEIVRQQRMIYLSDDLRSSLLDAMPGPAMVLNQNRQIVAANQILLRTLALPSVETLLGHRPGEGVFCTHSHETPGGCGTAEACTECGAVQAIIESLESRGRSTKECRIQTEGQSGGGALDFRMHASYLKIEGEVFVVLGLEDISSEKRRKVLERVFLHDMINLCGGLQGLATVLEEGADAATESTCKRGITQISTLLLDEIAAHREMLAAERGELIPEIAAVDVGLLFRRLGTAYEHHAVAAGRILRFVITPTARFLSDPVLLGRVLGNLIKNALEASAEGETVTVSCEPEKDGPAFTVHNPRVIPRAHQLQIFQRSFSTKDGTGRGLGTYSVRLLTERYLEGGVSFRSEAGVGTEFRVQIPWDLSQRKCA
jgi:signal transduction histidine kinase